MTPTRIRGDVVAERIGWIRDMTASIKKLPVADYHEVSSRELYNLCTQNLEDIESILSSFIAWLRANPEKTDQPAAE